MINTRLLGTSVTWIVITLFMTLQLAACSYEEAPAGTFAVTTGDAVISGNVSGSVTEDVDPDNDGLLEVGGKLNITDDDPGEAAFIAMAINGNYGALTISSTGNWLYAANNNQPAIQNLVGGSGVRDNLTVSSVDGTTRTVEITIIGADDANSPAVISGLDSGSVTEDVDPDGDNLLEAGGQLNITDNDPGEAAFIAMAINSNYGSLTINATGNWNYAANNNQTVIQNLGSGASLIDVITVSSVDGTMHNVVLTIFGMNEGNSPAVISGADSGSVQEDSDSDGDNLLEVSGQLNITDNDPGEAAFIANTINGNYGNLTINTAGNWFYEANNNQSVIQNLGSGASLIDVITVSSVDSTMHNVVLTILGIDEANSPAIISGADSGSVQEDSDSDGDNLLEVSGQLNITDNDPGEAAFIANTINGNYGNLTINTAGNWFYEANNNQSVIQNLDSGASLIDVITVSSVDSTMHNVVLTILGIDETNSPAVISGTDSGSITEDVDPDNDNLLEVGGNLNVTDSDPGESAFTADTINGNFGSLTINTVGDWNYSANNSLAAIQNLNNGTTLTDVLTISSVDGTTHNVVIVIMGVDETSTSNINLSWVAPVERENNDPLLLTEIAGYKAYYGSTQGQYSNSVTVNDRFATGYTVTNLPAGTYYFVVTTIDTAGRESQYSPEVTKLAL